MAKPVAMLPDRGSLAGHPRVWAWNPSGWENRKYVDVKRLDGHRLGWGGGGPAGGPNPAPCSVPVAGNLCARVCAEKLPHREL